ncbi:DUF1360 domain-containing protein [Sediminibacillus massiliensis]|uniref:DUF1360 domain-containing protein n=1 Tax=Sediminibacillus massiliensis TaxID=1926277 RepID=UPI001FEA1C57|nr:DUF1360 domain-containing protein [Sediminibacillus massiliensis]
MFTWFGLVLFSLATFRVTRLLVFDQITEFLRAPFHEWKEEVQEDGSIEAVIYLKGNGLRKFIGELLSCHWCTGIWSSVLLYVGYTLWPVVFYPIIIILAIAATASIIEVIVTSLS